MSLLPEGRKMTGFGRWKLVSPVPEECWHLSVRNLIIQVEIISGYLDSLRPNIHEVV